VLALPIWQGLVMGGNMARFDVIA
jgi:hypothetical protein